MFSENLHEWQEFYTTTAQISTLSHVTKDLWVLQRQKFLRNNVFQIFSWVLQILLFDCSWSHKHNFRATTSGGFYSSLLVPRGPGAVSNRLQQGWIWFWDFQPNWFLASAQIFKYCTSTSLFVLPPSAVQFCGVKCFPPTTHWCSVHNAHLKPNQFENWFFT